VILKEKGKRGKLVKRRNRTGVSKSPNRKEFRVKRASKLRLWTGAAETRKIGTANRTTIRAGKRGNAEGRPEKISLILEFMESKKLEEESASAVLDVKLQTGELMQKKEGTQGSHRRLMTDKTGEAHGGKKACADHYQNE